jgi:hypothetical protein
MLTRSSSSPYSRHAAIGTDANASLISHNVTSPAARPARISYRSDDDIGRPA